MRVVGYYVTQKRPITILVKSKQKISILSSRGLYDNGHVDGLNFRELFIDHEPPKKFIDKVRIEKNKDHQIDSKRFPIKITSKGKDYNDLIAKRYSYKICDLKDFFYQDLVDQDLSRIITIYDSNKKNQINESLFTDPERITEAAFIKKYVQTKAGAVIKTRIHERFFIKNGELFIPKEDRFFFLYLDDAEDPCKTMGALMGIERIVMGKIFKHLAEDMCPFVSVSLSKNDFAYDSISNVIFSNPDNMKLEFNSCTFETCSSHEVKLDSKNNNDDLYRQRVVGAVGNSKDFADILSLVVKPSLFNRCSEKYSGRKRRKGDIVINNCQWVVHRHPILIGIKTKPRFYLCYDPTMAKILCYGNDVETLVDVTLKGLYIKTYRCPVKFFKDNRLTYRLQTKPRHYEIMKNVAFFLSKPPVLRNVANFKWYDKGAVVFTVKKNVKKKTTTCFDFDNFYGTSLTVNSIDPGLVRTVEQLVAARQYANKKAKMKLVSLIGLAKYYDPLTHNLIKHACVTECLRTIEYNRKIKNSLISVTTDGITYKGNHEKIKIANSDYRIKREYKLTKFVFYETCNKYIGWDALSKQFLIKGIVGKNNPPVIKTFVTLFLLISCKILSSVKKRSFCETKRYLKRMYKKLSNSLNPSEDYLFAEYPGENKHKMKYFPAEFAYNDLCQDRMLCFADFSKFPNNKIFFSTVHQRRNPEIVDKFFLKGLSHVNSTFKIDHEKYASILRAKIDSACELLARVYPQKRKFVEFLKEKTKAIINETLEIKINLPQDAAVIPGALFDLS